MAAGCAVATGAETDGATSSWPLREIVKAIFYVMRGGVAWRLLPSDLAPKSTADRWFAAWRDGGVFEALIPSAPVFDRCQVGPLKRRAGLTKGP